MLICFIILLSLWLQLSPDFNQYVYKEIKILELQTQRDVRDYLVILQMRKLRAMKDE